MTELLNLNVGSRMSIEQGVSAPDATRTEATNLLKRNQMMLDGNMVFLLMLATRTR